MTTKTFKLKSNFYRSEEALSPRTDETIKNEPMLFNCDVRGAIKLGGPITNEFLDKLVKELKDSASIYDMIFDSRVHMLMPTWYPCISGWHTDDVPRSRPDGQPNYDNPEYKSKHCMALVNSYLAPTEFAVGTAEYPDIEPGEKYYKKWHPIVEQHITEGKLERKAIEGNNLYFFDWQTFHQGVQAVGSGWRFFIRASWNTGRKATNEIRRQVQIYLPNPIEGW